MTTPTPLPHAVAIQMCSDFDEGSQSCGDPNHSPESCTCLKLSRAWRKMESDLAAAQEWREAVLNELIVAHIYTKEHDTNPRKAIQDAITWNCQVALDPAVSEDAQKLISAAQEALNQMGAAMREARTERDEAQEARKRAEEEDLKTRMMYHDALERAAACEKANAILAHALKHFADESKWGAVADYSEGYWYMTGKPWIPASKAIEQADAAIDAARAK